MAMKQFIYLKNKLLIFMKKKDSELINSLYQKLTNFKKDGLIITRKEVEEFFSFLIKKN